MAGGNEIVVRHVIVTESGGEFNSTSSLTGENLEQASLALKTIADKLDAALSNKSQYFKNKDPQAEQTRKLEMINAQTEANLLKKEKQLQDDKKRLGANAASQIAILREAKARDLAVSQARSAQIDKEHANRKELMQLNDSRREKQKYLAAAIGVGAALASLGKSIGNSYASYETSNALIRPDLAYSQLVSSQVSTGTNYLSGALVSAGLATGNPLLALGGGLIGGAVNFIAPQIAAGYQLQNSGQYFSQMPQYSYGAAYQGMNPAFMKNAMFMPGGPQNMQQMLYSSYGSVGNAKAFQSLSQGSTLFGMGTGSQLVMGQIISALPGIIKSTGVGQSSEKISTLLSTLTEYQRKYGGDTVQNLQAISSLLQSSAVGSSTMAANIAYGSQLFNPALQGAAVNYASSSPINQFVQDTLTKGMLGVSMNDLMGMNGSDRQARALAIAQKKVGRFTPGQLTSGNIAGSVALGSAFYPVMRAQPGNLGLMGPDARMAALSSMFNFSGTGGTLTPQNMQGVIDPQTEKLIQQQQQAAGEYTITASTVNLIAKGIATSGLSSIGEEFHNIIHKDPS